MAARADASWHAVLDELHLKKDTAEFVIHRCGRLAAKLPEGVPAIPAAPSETPPLLDDSDRRRPCGHHPDATDPGADGRTAGRQEPAWFPSQDLHRIDEELVALGGLQATQVPADGCVCLAIFAACRGRGRRPGPGHRPRLDGQQRSQE